MAIAIISEYQSTGILTGGVVVSAGQEPAQLDQPVTFTTSAQSAAFGAHTKLVRIETDALAHFVFGDAPVATVGNKRIQAGVPEYFGVTPGMKVAFYDGVS